MLAKIWKVAKIITWLAAFSAMFAAPYLVEHRSTEALLALLGTLAFFTYNQCVLRDRPSQPDPGFNPVNVPEYYLCPDSAILGVRARASRSDIIAAFRRMAKRHHPDKGGSPQAFRKLSEAKDRLLQSAAQ
jgi:hypothetical protein